MSPTLKRGLLLAVALFIAAVLQCAFANPMRIGAAQPDFLALVAFLGALYCDGNGGAALGFSAGLLHAAIVSPPHAGFGSLITSRTAVCFCIGWLDERIFRDNPLMAVLLVALGTALAHILFFIFMPMPDIGHWARILALTTLYNTMLALPVYLLMRRYLGVEREQNRF